MIHSISRFLLISLFITIAIASSVTAIGNYLLDSKVLHPLLDDQLYKTYSIVRLTLENTAVNKKNKNSFNEYINKIATSGSRKLFFAVISPQQNILFHSKTTLKIPNNLQKGFSDININNTGWRVYSDNDPITHNRILVAESYETRNKLVDSIARNNLYILLFTYPIFALLAWLIVNVALRCITQVTSEIAHRAPNWLEPVPNENTPIEIQPLITALNQLLMRVKLAFERSRRFAGDAAHELRTPLAAIQTQAQVALRTTDVEKKQVALQKVMQGVSRTSHIINQLLTLSRLGHEEELNDTHLIDLHRIATETLASLIPLARNKNISVTMDPPPATRMISGNDIALDMLMRNIIDNAIRYTPKNGEIYVSILHKKHHIIFQVIDSGPGIPVELQKNVFSRFYRMIGNQSQGSGLGLAIVQQIAKLHRAEITLENTSDSGLQFRVAFPISCQL